MRGPSGVADAVGAVEWLEANRLFQVAQLAFGAANLQATAIAGDRDTGRIVSAILKTAQAIDDDRHNTFFPYIADDAAHTAILPRAKASGVYPT
jgi:hypothetical protein